MLQPAFFAAILGAGPARRPMAAVMGYQVELRAIHGNFGSPMSSKDPFGSVDAPTAAWILEALGGLLGLPLCTDCHLPPFAGASLWSHAAESGANGGVAARERVLIKEIFAQSSL